MRLLGTCRLGAEGDYGQRTCNERLECEDDCRVATDLPRGEGGEHRQQPEPDDLADGRSAETQSGCSRQDD